MNKILEKSLLVGFELDFVGSDSNFGEKVLGDLHEHKIKLNRYECL